MPRKYKVGDWLEKGRVVYEVPVEHEGSYYMLIQLEEGGHPGTVWDGFRPRLIPVERRDLREMKHLSFLCVGKDNPDTYDGYDID